MSFKLRTSNVAQNMLTTQCDLTELNLDFLENILMTLIRMSLILPQILPNVGNV